MKKDMESYLSSEKENLSDLCKFLYNNPEESYSEYECCRYISNFLSEKGFNVTNSFLGLNTSFCATKGSGYPKICYVCEYDAIKEAGHITGHNLLSTISVGAAIALGHIIEKSSGTVILLGCPGEYLGGTKSTMVHQGFFDDIDVVLEAHPDIVTCESGTSAAIIPLQINFSCVNGLRFLNEYTYSCLDAALLTLNTVNVLMKGFPDDVKIDSVLSKGGTTPSLMPNETEIKFYIRAKDMDLAMVVDQKIKEVCYYISKLMRVQNSTSLYEPPSEELLTNLTLNRLLSHNLKEHGIIDIKPPRDIRSGLSLGVVSQKAPCIQSFISIIEDDSIKYGTKEFRDSTLTNHALEIAVKTALALAATGYDIIQSEELLGEIKGEFYSFKKNLK
ncbi:amidohydrolase [Clostridium zeae]|uniref:Peptidase M20 domain-containing protein 2 n=1 Tax=Clostridium zeae TaxID=2759022 RepID=A0ABQ1EDM8_9CLOT|nr:M20 family peptidase [Clostridium zeae]GFZ32914.1 amidohydrolase [Clostridium zeae]